MGLFCFSLRAFTTCTFFLLFPYFLKISPPSHGVFSGIALALAPKICIYMFSIVQRVYILNWT